MTNSCPFNKKKNPSAYSSSQVPGISAVPTVEKKIAVDANYHTMITFSDSMSVITPKASSAETKEYRLSCTGEKMKRKFKKYSMNLENKVTAT